MQDPFLIRVAVLSRYQLDCDGIASLLKDDSRFDVVAKFTDLRNVIDHLRPLRSHVVIIDAKMGDHRAFKTGQRLLTKGATKSVLFIDSEPNRYRAERALAFERSGYLTRKQAFNEIRTGIVTLVRGGQPIDPITARWMPPRGSSRPIRKHRLDPPATSALSAQEKEVLRLLAEGNTVNQCADILGIMPSTADNHKSSVMKKMGTHTTVELVRLAIREGVIRA